MLTRILCCIFVDEGPKLQFYFFTFCENETSHTTQKTPSHPLPVIFLAAVFFCLSAYEFFSPLDSVVSTLTVLSLCLCVA